MSAHTTGPWAFNVETNTVEDSEGVPVCSLPTLEAESSYEQTILADAALIRAAPDLLATLKNLTGLFEALHSNAAEWGDYQAALAAISKAEGQS